MFVKLWFRQVPQGCLPYRSGLGFGCLSEVEMIVDDLC